MNPTETWQEQAALVAARQPDSPPGERRGPTIRQKLVRIALVATLTALVLQTSAFVFTQWRDVRARTVRRLTTAASIIGYNSASAVVFDDADAAARTLEALLATEDRITGAAILKADGEVLAFQGRVKGARPALPAWMLRPAQMEHRFEDDRLYLAQPIHLEGRRVGAVVIESDLGAMRAAIRTSMTVALGVALVTLAVALLVASRYLVGVSRPILALAQAAERVSQKREYDLRVEAQSGDEVGTLVHTFNDMLAQIQRRERELEEFGAENERLYRDASTASRLKDEFLATLSHELRTPLNAIAGWTQLLRSGQLDENGRERAIETIDRNTQAQIRLIEDVLDVSRIVSGKLQLQIRTVDLREVARTVIDSLRPAAEGRELGLTLAKTEPLPAVRGDFERLQQVLWNLVSNAIKFTPRGGRVKVDLHAAEGQVEIVVSDSGVGIEPEFLPYVFERFRQADASTTRSHGGLGLGLAIVRHVVEMHGGTVTASSPGKDQGASFTVRLPAQRLAAEGHPPGSPAPGPDGPTAPPGLRVLVVDDDEDSRQLLLVYLERAGAIGLGVKSGPEALQAILSGKVDVLISDIGMPEMDGYALIRRVRELPADSGGEMPAAALTAYARPRDRDAALAAGFDAYLPKPFDFANLSRTLTELAARRRTG